MRTRLYAIATAALLILPAAGCRVRQTQEGELPKVDVEGGQVPKYDVDTARVDVKTRTEQVEVPKVDVHTEKQNVKVPDVDVTMPPPDGEHTTAKPKPPGR